ncbi:type II secretion system F family protein [Hydrogenimonas thermophila]|uniref:type II secretion system F family protein n=1 Tax=Hydrogenimonas thermophila TaxID=223786 RepID=UPI002936F39F|nr:type II secretion system F family protein [Hydrogenimonas thermophila]WOE68940.1 type II secretion system F family protein [Hydrogenimonas thermophila]WOE71447.1 type II secretion system F family protein [Hydrogenimonas thermophila]
MKYYLATMLLKGIKQSHLVKAEDRADAINRIKKEYKGTLLKVEEVSPPLEDIIKEYLSTFKALSGARKVQIKHLIAAIRQLAVMTNAGISIHDALHEIANSTTDKQLKKILLEAFEDINAGLSLSHTFNRYKTSVGGLTIAMIELGEQTGNISEALASLADMLEEIEDNIMKFKKAMRYPMITLGAMAIAFTILILMVVPKFKSIFEKFHTELPLPTKILLNIENVLNNYGLLVLGGLILTTTITMYLYRKNYDFKYYVDAFLLKIYLIKDIIFFATLNRFAIIFTELVHAGIPIADALDTATSMIDNAILKEKLETVKISVSRGVSLTESFKETGVFENMIIQMINAGESSGQLDSMMRKVTDYYRMRFNYILDNLSSYIEPVMLTIIAALVLLLALGIFLPMWDMAGAVNGH